MKYKNNTPFLLTFDLRGKTVQVASSDTIEIEDRLDYVISSCKVSLTKIDDIVNEEIVLPKKRGKNKIKD